MKKKLILLADDSEFFLEFEKTFFSKDNFILRTAHNGQEALEIVNSAFPDIVFLDLFMPGMNGDDCCRIIKKDPKTRHIPVVIISGIADERDLERCRQAGCDDILFKPINRNSFIETTKKHLNIQHENPTRYNANLLIFFGKDPDQRLMDYSINLSTGGVFLETMNLMEENTPLKAEFVLPHHDTTINCKARVAWVNHPRGIKNPKLPVGMGIQFLDLTDEDLSAVRGYIIEDKLSPMW